MPVPYTAAQIKAWFETGDFPTQQQFADMVDTFFHMAQQANDTADAAAANAADALAAAQANPCKAFGRFIFLTTVAPGPYITAYRELGGTLTAVQLSGSSIRVTFTFDTAQPDANYTVSYVEGLATNPAVTKYVDKFTIDLVSSGSLPLNSKFGLAVFA